MLTASQVQPAAHRPPVYRPPFAHAASQKVVVAPPVVEPPAPYDVSPAFEQPAAYEPSVGAAHQHVAAHQPAGPLPMMTTFSSESSDIPYSLGITHAARSHFCAYTNVLKNNFAVRMIT